MLDALKQAFKANHHVDFHGSYELVEASVSHKQRVQSLTVDIWRATGYRFTCDQYIPSPLYSPYLIETSTE